MKKKAKKAGIARSESLTQTLQTKGRTATDKQFLENLSRWVIDAYGDVNVAQRLNILSNRRRTKGVRNENEIKEENRDDDTLAQTLCGPYRT